MWWWKGKSSNWNDAFNGTSVLVLNPSVRTNRRMCNSSNRHRSQSQPILLPLHFRNCTRCVVLVVEIEERRHDFTKRESHRTESLVRQTGSGRRFRYLINIFRIERVCVCVLRSTRITVCVRVIVFVRIAVHCWLFSFCLLLDCVCLCVASNVRLPMWNTQEIVSLLLFFFHSVLFHSP